MMMFETAGAGAMKSYDPALSDAENIQRMFLIYQSHADPTLPKCQIKASAQCTFNKAKSTYDPSKRGKGGDRSSERQRYRSNSRWNGQRYDAELLIDCAKRVGVSYSTVKSWKANGELRLINKMWVRTVDEKLKAAATRLGKSYATLKRWRANGEIELFDGMWGLRPSQSLTDSQTVNETELVPEAEQSQPATVCDELQPDSVEPLAGAEPIFDVDKAFEDFDYEFEPANQFMAEAKIMPDEDNEFMMLLNNHGKWHREVNLRAAEERPKFKTHTQTNELIK
jgi:transposase